MIYFSGIFLCVGKKEENSMGWDIKRGRWEFKKKGKPSVSDPTPTHSFVCVWVNQSIVIVVVGAFLVRFLFVEREKRRRRLFSFHLSTFSPLIHYSENLSPSQSSS